MHLKPLLLELEDFLPHGTLWVKDERGRMGLGSFKALGAAYVIASHAQELDENPALLLWKVKLT